MDRIQGSELVVLHLPTNAVVDPMQRHRTYWGGITSITISVDQPLPVTKTRSDSGS